MQIMKQQTSSAHARRRWGPRQLASLLGVETPEVRTLRVLVAGKLTALVSPGGGEVQMQRTLSELRRLGVEARWWRPWEQRLAEADVVHLFGSEREHLSIVAAARQLGIPVVLSTVAWFDLASLWHESWSMPRRLLVCGKHLLRSAAPRLPSWRRQLYQACDRLLPNSRAEAAQLVKMFGVDAEKIRVVPNGADERFATGDPEPFIRQVGCRRFVLYAGRIEPRKNQLTFLRAMHGANVPVVVLGDAVPGHEEYYNACRQAADANVQFVSRIEHGNTLLASAYAACGALALASWYETPGLVALEAGMSGVPLVLPKVGCAEEYFGRHAEYVSAGDLHEIRSKTLAALARDRSPELASLVREQYSWRAAAQATRVAYAEVV